jgi:hypothetical protein
MMVENAVIGRRAELSPEKQALLELRLRGALKTAGNVTRIPRREQTDKAPLSFAQQRLWFFTQLEPDSSLYNLPTAVRLRGRLNRAALQASLTAIVARHETLRTRFVAEEGNPVQVIGAPWPVELPVLDLSRRPEPQREADLQRWLQEEAVRPFDLAREFPMRAALAQLGATDHVLMLDMHHVISDAWSLAVFFRELVNFYEAFGNGHVASLPELPIQYADYAVWQRDGLRGEVMEKHLA